MQQMLQGLQGAQGDIDERIRGLPVNEADRRSQYLRLSRELGHLYRLTAVVDDYIAALGLELVQHEFVQGRREFTAFQNVTRLLNVFVGMFLQVATAQAFLEGLDAVSAGIRTMSRELAGALDRANGELGMWSERRHTRLEIDDIRLLLPPITGEVLLVEGQAFRNVFHNQDEGLTPPGVRAELMRLSVILERNQHELESFDLRN